MTNESNQKNVPELDEILLQEYNVCNNKAHVYVTVGWQVAAIFIAASILTLGYSAQLYPKTVGILLVPLSLSLIVTWYYVDKRFNWLNQRCYDRAKAIEYFFANENTERIPLSYKNSKDKIINTEMINSWIEKLESAKEPPILPVRKILRVFIGVIISVSIVILLFYLISFLCN